MNNRLNKDWRNKNWFWFAWHPLEEELLAFLDGELGVKPASKVQKHLEGCWACRAQREKIERSISVFINYRQAALAEAAATRRRAQTRFADKLSRLAAEQTEQKQAFFRHGTLAGQFSQFRPSLWATAVVLLSIGLGVWFGSDRQVSASELLRNATAAQAAKLHALEGPVVYQKLRVRRLAAASARPETANWEIWDDTTRGRFRQSVEDSGGRRLLPVTAGDRAARADQAPPPILAELTQLLAANHMDPQRPLSAASYQSWRDSIASKHEEVARTQLPDKREVHLLRTVPASQVKAGQIAEATFGVRAQDWLPCDLRLKVKAEEGERIYEIIEQASEVVSLAQLSPEIFAAPIVMPLKPVVALQPSPAPAPTSVPVKAKPAPPAVTAELEIEVLSLLNQVGATLGEEVSVARTLDGSLRVEGVVESSERQREVLATLASLKEHPAVRLQIETPAEAAARLQQLRRPYDPVTVQIQEAAPTGSAIPLEPEVRRYLIAQAAQGTPADKLAEAVNQFANRALKRSRQALLYVWSLRRLVERFSPNDLRTLDPQARSKWLAMIGEHAHGYQRELAALRQELTPVLNLAAAADDPVSEIADEADLARAVVRLNEAGTATDEAIRAAFTLSAGASPAIRSPQFWRTLSNAESLAQKIEQATQQLKGTANTMRR